MTDYSLYKKNGFMKTLKRPALQIWLLLGAFALALALRLIRLGASPLTNLEAETALEALALSRGVRDQFGPHMAYVGLTGLDFLIFNSGNFLARFWPAFMGALIVFVPWLLRDQIGRWPATIAALLLAISPEMVGVSRIIGSPMTAFVLLLLAIGFLFQRKPILSGICFALALMSGPGFWMGTLILGVSYIISERLFNISLIFPLSGVNNHRSHWIRFGISVALTLLVIGTGFFLEPEGLSGVFSGLVLFVKGFFSPVVFPFMLLPMTLLAYSLGAVIFGVWGGLRGILLRNKLDMFLFLWSVVGLGFIFLYPGSTPADIIWGILPLWFLSARAAFFAWRFPTHSHLIMSITAVLLVVVSVFMLLALRVLVTPNIDQTQQHNAFIAFASGIVLMVAIILLVYFGWSETVALSGFLIALAVLLGAGMLSVSVNSTGLSMEVSQELWYPNQAALSAEWLDLSIERVIDWQASGGALLEIHVADYDTPGMRWVLRDYDRVQFVPFLAPQSQPSMVITKVEEVPEISSSYRGQDLVWSRQALWDGMTPFQYLQWIITRQAPTVSDQIIFWVRTDLLPDAQFSP